MTRLSLHGPTVRARFRVDRELLALTAVVVALTTALLAAVTPLTVRTADRAMADVVADASPGGSLVATAPSPPFNGIRVRQPLSADRFEQSIETTQDLLPEPLASVVRPSVASLTSPFLEVTGPGTTRHLRLAYLLSADGTTDGTPAVEYTQGRAPRPSGTPAQAGVQLDFGDPPWPVEVALSEDAAAAIQAGAGDRLTLQDEFSQPVEVRISGLYVAVDPRAAVWREAPELLSPSFGPDGEERVSTGALVSSAALPDLRIAVPSDRLTQKIVFVPVPDRVRWRDTPTLQRQLGELQSSPGTTAGQIGWESILGRVLDDGLTRVSTTRGQTQVVQQGLLAAALLLLVLAARLLVGRRAGSLTLARERGASLPAVAAELLPESVVVAAVGAGAGIGLAAVLVGSADWRAAAPVVVVAALAPPVLGAVEAARATDARRAPANRAARRAVARARRARRLALEAAVLALAVVTFVALRQRGAVEDDLTTASATAWWTVAGALVLGRLVPPAVRLALRVARRGTGRVALFVTARLAQPGRRALALLVVTVSVAQLVVAGSLATSLQRGQAAGALLEVGGDARLTTSPDGSLRERAEAAAAASGVDAAVAARVDDGVLLEVGTGATTVRLVVVDAPTYRRLLAESPLPDAAQLGELTRSRSDGDLPALLLGGPADRGDRVELSWDSRDVPLVVVGEAPRVGGSLDPVLLLDAEAFAAAAGGADPDTVWAVGPGAEAALAAVADDAAGESVTTYADVLADRRDSPLTSALVALTRGAALLLLLLAALGIVVGAAADAPARAVSAGRLRSLGLEAAGLRRVLTGELVAPTAAGVLAGVALGVGCAFAVFGALGLEEVTGQTEPPAVVVPWWTAVATVVLVAIAAGLARREARALQRTSLARLLRSGDGR